MLKSHICFNNKTLQRKMTTGMETMETIVLMICLQKNTNFVRFKRGRKKEEKKPTQDFRDFSVGRERANKQFFCFGLTSRWCNACRCMGRENEVRDNNLIPLHVT